jgi:O-antigen/teichoic acid export membrane protein
MHMAKFALDTRVRRMLAQPLVRDNALLFASAGCVGLANYLLNIAAARRFPSGVYSEFGIALNLLAAFAPVTSSVMGAMIRRGSFGFATGEEGETDATQRSLLRHLSGIFLVALVAVALFRGPIGATLHLPDVAPLYFVVATAFFTFLHALFQGVLQAEGRYGRLAAISVGEALFRGVVGVAAIAAGVGLVGVVAIYTLSAALAVCYFPRPPALWTGTGAAKRVLRPVYRDMAQLAVANVCMVLLINLDIIFCRRYLPPEIADRYVAIAAVAKFFIFATASVAIVAFAAFVNAIHRGEAVLRPFALSFGLLALLGGGFILTCLIIGPLLIGVTFGAAYRGSAHALWITAVDAVAISFINMAIAYWNARERRWYVFVLIPGSAALVGLLAAAGGSLERYAGFYAAGMVALAVVVLLPILADVRTHRRASADRPRAAGPAIGESQIEPFTDRGA